MINKIIGATFLFCLFLAIFLAGLGIQRIELGEAFLTFMREIGRNTEASEVQIPNIPTIPPLDSAQGISVLRVLIGFVNGIVTFLNVIVSILNFIIKVFTFIFFLIKALIELKDNLANAPSIPEVESVARVLCSVA